MTAIDRGKKIRPGAVPLSVLLLALAALLASSAPAAAACPNEAIRQEQGTTNLPDCMALEMVSPAQKSNYRAGEPVLPASISANGERVVFESPAALGGTEDLLAPLGDAYIATRGASGWSTTATSPPAAFGFGYAGVTSVAYPLSLTPDFGRWFSLQNTVAQAQNGAMTAYEAALGGVWSPRSNLLVPLDGHHGKQQTREIYKDLMGVSTDLSHLFVRPTNNFVNEANGYSTAYLPGDPQPRGGGNGITTQNTYVLDSGPLGEPRISLLARDSSGKLWGGNCGTTLGGGEAAQSVRGQRNQGAVSGDGTEVLFNTGPLEPQPYADAPTYPRCAGSGTANVNVGNATIENVVTAKGTGATSTTTEPNVVSGVTTTTGAFAVGQTVKVGSKGNGVAPGTTITAVEAETEALSKITLSNPVTSEAETVTKLAAGAAPFAVGEEVSATTTCAFPSSGPCFAPGTTITAVTGQTITVSPTPIGSGTAKTILATPPRRIMQRSEGPGGEVTISQLIEGGPAGGNDFFEGASVNQDRIYFTSERKLAASDLDPTSEGCTQGVKLPTLTSQGCDLYLYEKLPGGGHELIQVSAGGTGDPTPGEGADVIRGVVAISGDGSHVYYGAEGVLTTEPNPEGAVAQQGKLNLYLYERDAKYPNGRTAFVGELDSACTDASDCAPSEGRLVGAEESYGPLARAVPIVGQTGEGEDVGGDGHILVFQSTAPLTADDTDGHHLDVFRYDSAAEPPTLECVSCLPGGVPDSGAFDVSTRTGGGSHQPIPGLEFAERGRWATEDGEGIVFATAEALLPEDVDGVRSDYLWQDGQLTLLPGTGRQPTVSSDGHEVAFETAAALLPQDGDTAVSVYMARVDGGFPNPPATTPCSGEACQGPASAIPAAQSPGSQTFKGSGNPKPEQQQKKHKKTKHKKKHHKKKHGSKRVGTDQKGGRK